MTPDPKTAARLRYFSIGFRYGASLQKLPPKLQSSADAKAGFERGRAAYAAAMTRAEEHLRQFKTDSDDSTEAGQSPEAKKDIGQPPLSKRVLETTVKCEKTGQVFEAIAMPTGLVRWVCPCGHLYEKQLTELPFLPTEILIPKRDCLTAPWKECPTIPWDQIINNEVMDHQATREYPTVDALEDFKNDPRTGANLRRGPEKPPEEE